MRELKSELNCQLALPNPDPRTYHHDLSFKILYCVEVPGTSTQYSILKLKS